MTFNRIGAAKYRILKVLFFSRELLNVSSGHPSESAMKPDRRALVRKLPRTYPQATAEQPVVIDTTGSVVYVGDALLRRLKSLATLVYLSTPPESSEQLYETFLNDPKPMIWQGRFSPHAGESNEATLAHSLPELLESRRRDYSALADRHLDSQTLRRPGLEAQDFLRLLSAQAPM